MSTALYKALLTAGVSDEQATAAAQEASQSERLMQIERDLAELKTSVRFLMAIQIAILALLVAPLL